MTWRTLPALQLIRPVWRHLHAVWRTLPATLRSAPQSATSQSWCPIICKVTLIPGRFPQEVRPFQMRSQSRLQGPPGNGEYSHQDACEPGAWPGQAEVYTPVDTRMASAQKASGRGLV